MARLIYSMLTSLDGYVEDASGGFGWAMPDDEVHAFVNQLGASIGTYLYGRRMYEVMLYWETADQQPDPPPVILEWARHWQAADKVVYSRTLAAPQSARTRVEKDFDAEAVRQLKAGATRDLSISGPELAAEAMRAGLVDEVQVFLFPVVVGGGKRFFPDGVPVELELLEHRRFVSGVVYGRYALRATDAGAA